MRRTQINVFGFALMAAALLSTTSVRASDVLSARECASQIGVKPLDVVATEIQGAQASRAAKPSRRMQFILVRFPLDRAVLIDDARGAWRTNEVLQVARGHHVIRIESLPGEQAAVPIGAAIVGKGTTVLTPMILEFK